MHGCDFGVVFCRDPTGWSKIVPAQFVYSATYERVIRRIIDRQLVVRELQHRTPRVCIIIDDIDLTKLKLDVIGFVNLDDLGSVLNDLNVRMYTGKCSDTQKFPVAWSWARSQIHRTQLRKYIEENKEPNIDTCAY